MSFSLLCFRLLKQISLSNITLTLSLLARNAICSADQNSILANFVYLATVNSVRSQKLKFEQVTASNISYESYFYKDCNGCNPIKIF